MRSQVTVGGEGWEERVGGRGGACDVGVFKNSETKAHPFRCG